MDVQRCILSLAKTLDPILGCSRILRQTLIHIHGDTSHDDCFGLTNLSSLAFGGRILVNYGPLDSESVL